MNLDEIRDRAGRVISGESGSIEGMVELIEIGDEATLQEIMGFAGEAMIMAWTAVGNDETALEPIWDAVRRRAEELGMET